MPSILNQNLTRAILFCCGYGVLTSISTLFVKLAAPHTTDPVIVFFRFAVSLTYILLILGIKYLRGKHFTFATKKPSLHMIRAASAFLCQLALFYALQYIPLTDGNLLFMTNPLFVPILGAIFLGVKTNKKNWLAIILGFIGIVLVLKPGHEMFNPVALIALSSGLFAAISILGIHELGKVDDAYTIMFYYFAITFLISASVVLFSWQTPDLHTLMLLIIIGILCCFGQECSIRALINAPAKIVAPLFYTTIIFSGILDWLFWHHLPDLISWIGMLTVIIASYLTVIFANQPKKKSPTNDTSD